MAKVDKVYILHWDDGRNVEEEGSSYDDAAVEPNYLQRMVLSGCMDVAVGTLCRRNEVLALSSLGTYAEAEAEAEDVGIVEHHLCLSCRTAIEQDAFSPYYERLCMLLVETVVVAASKVDPV